jgi:hypothetical protein
MLSEAKDLCIGTHSGGNSLPECSQILVKARKRCNSRQTLESMAETKWQTLSQFPAKNATLKVKIEKGRDPGVSPFYLIPSSLARTCHLLSTIDLVLASIVISSGHGRANPSVDHFRVASIPIFEPKLGRREA